MGAWGLGDLGSDGRRGLVRGSGLLRPRGGAGRSPASDAAPRRLERFFAAGKLPLREACLMRPSPDNGAGRRIDGIVRERHAAEAFRETVVPRRPASWAALCRRQPAIRRTEGTLCIRALRRCLTGNGQPVPDRKAPGRSFRWEAASSRNAGSGQAIAAGGFHLPEASGARPAVGSRGGHVPSLACLRP